MPDKPTIAGVLDYEKRRKELGLPLAKDFKARRERQEMMKNVGQYHCPRCGCKRILVEWYDVKHGVDFITFKTARKGMNAYCQDCLMNTTSPMMAVVATYVNGQWVKWKRPNER